MKSAVIYIAIAALGGGLGFLIANPNLSSELEPRELSTSDPIAKADVAERWTVAAKLPNHARRDALDSLADKISPDEIESCLATLRFPLELRIASKLLVSMGESDAPRALRLLESLPLPEWPVVVEKGYDTDWQKASTRGKIYRVWVRHDLETALASMEAEVASAPKWSNQSQVLVGLVVVELSKTDPERAVELQATHSVETDPWTMGLGGTDYIQLAGRTLDAKTRARVQSYSYFTRAKENPQLVLQEMLATPPGTSFDNGITWTVGRYTGEDLMRLRMHTMGEQFETTDWSHAGEIERNGFDISGWAKRDLQAALDWTESLPENARVHFRAQALIGAALNDPSSALPEIDKLPPAQRELAMEVIAPEWYHRDQSAARAWAESLDEPDLKVRVIAALGEE